MSTPYSEGRNDDRGPSPMTGRPSSPETLEFGPETIPIARPAGDHPHRPAMEARPAAPIQRFNNKSLNWPAWFRHFRTVADVHAWLKEQRALQLVSYLDETAMNVAQELGDSDLYNYDVLIKLLGDWFDPASRVSASHSRFHARLRRHHEDADAFADALAQLCRVGYPQSPPELRQELIAEQFVRGQSDPELKKYLWVVIRTQKDKKLQTLIEVCTDFSSLEMRPIAGQPDAQRRPPGNRPSPDQNRGFRPPARTGQDYSRIKCFSCGKFGHMQSRCRRSDSSLPFKPAGWQLQSDNRPPRDGNSSPGNS